MAVILDPGVIPTVRRRGESAYPRECCGFLVGTVDSAGKRVNRAVFAPNRWTDPRREGYRIDPRVYLRVERAAAARGLRILGFYHSHPDGPAVPSVRDRENAIPWCSYMIVSVPGGRARDVNSWTVTKGRGLEREILETGRRPGGEAP